jgi:hypothetical protein
VSYSEQFDNADWLKYQCSVSANQTTSPDGTQNADKLTLSGSSGTYTGLLYRLIAVGANSIYMKNDSIGSGKFYIQVDGVGNAKWNADGTLNSVSGGTATNGENMGNGWFRFTFVVTSGSYINYGIADATTGNSIFIWGAQVEAGSYATSYIVSTSASATRVADACSKTGISSLIGQTEGTMFAQMSAQDSPANNWFQILDGGANNWIFIGLDGSKFRGYVRLGSSTVFDNLTFTLTNGVAAKIALAYKSGDIALYINGSQIAVSSNTFTPSASISQVIFGDLTSPPQDSAKYSQAVLFKTRLTNAELASLTTI